MLVITYVSTECQRLEEESGVGRVPKKTTRRIRKGRYRQKRAYLADNVFLDVPGGGAAPNDLLSRKKWKHLMDLPTDNVLRTTDYLGTLLDDMLTQSYQWLKALPGSMRKAPFMFEVALDAYDELESAPFIAAHGWYRQGTAALRNALETMTHAARYAVHDDTRGFQAWRTGESEAPKFGNSVDLLHQDPTLAPIEVSLGGSGLFGNNPDGVLRSLYHDVCRYAHSAPGYTNADLWRGSNGPVFIGAAFTQLWTDYCDVLLACYVLLKVGHPPVKLPKSVRSIPAAAGSGWHGIAPQAIKAYFP